MRFRIALAAVAVVLGAAQAQAQVATFDDLPGSGTAITSSYAGKNWEGFGVITDGEYSFGSHSSSPSNYAYAYCCGATVRITNGGNAFNFLSAYVSDLQNTNDSFTVTGYSTTLLYTAVVAVGSVGYTYNFNFLNVTEVDFSSQSGSNLALDDVAFSESETTPEPASMVLLATGLVGVIGAARRRRNSAA